MNPRTVLLKDASRSDSLHVNRNKRIVHLNHAGASPSPDPVVERVMEHLRLEQSLGGYAAAEQVKDELNGVYQSIANLIYASSNDQIALVESATVGWTRIFYAVLGTMQKMGSQRQPGVILMSQAEYAANVVAAIQWTRTTNKNNIHHHQWRVLCIPSVTVTNDDGSISTGKVDLQIFQGMFCGKYEYYDVESQSMQRLDPSHIRLVCITHVPTNSGMVNPVYEIGDIIAQFNQLHHHRDNDDGDQKTEKMNRIFYLVDACQSVGQMNVDVSRMQCHGLVATGRKFLRGPRGTGFMYVAHPESWTPDHIDHYSMPIDQVPNISTSTRNIMAISSLLQMEPRKGARRFEFWESSIANKLGLGIAIQMVLTSGIESIAKTIQERVQYLYHQLQINHQQLQLHHPPESGIVTFWIEDIKAKGKASMGPTTATILKDWLWQLPEVDETTTVSSIMFDRFEVSVVPATSTPFDSAITGVPDMVRASVSYTTTTEALDRFCDRIQTWMMLHS